jgi:hypothetical protein
LKIKGIDRWVLLYSDLKGKMNILPTWSHMSGLSNGKKLTDFRRNGMKDSKVEVSGTQVQTNFLVAHMYIATF